MRAEAAGDPGPWRQQAILGRGQWDADALRDIVRDYVVEHWRPMTRCWWSTKPAFSSRARHLAEWPPVHRLGGQDHQLPDRRVRRVCLAPWPCLHRPGAVSAEGLDGRSRADGGGARARTARSSRPSRGSPSDDRAGDRGRTCRSPGWRPTASTGSAMSRWRCGAPAKAMCLASIPTQHFSSWRQAAGRRHGRRDCGKGSTLRAGSACRRATARRARGCMTGLIANWLTSTPPNTTTRAPACGRAAC